MSDDRVFGQPVLRREDERFLKGSARFVSDVQLPNTAEVVIKRSPVAHAMIVDIDVSEAMKLSGVVAVLTAKDLVDVKPYTPYHASPSAFIDIVHPMEKSQTVPLLADDRVRRVGEPVALVVAEDRYIAEDAAALVRVEYSYLEPVLDPESGLRPDSPVIFDELGDNVQSRVSVATGDVDGALEAADHRQTFRFTIRRQVGSPLEPRGVVAHHDPAVGGMTVWSATQMPHLSRRVIGGILGIAPEDLRVICPDMGGSFGGGVYYEDILLPYLARRLGRPVRWIEDRTENLTNARHARDQVHDVEVGFNDDGRIVALKDRILVDMGMANFYGLVVPYNTITHLRSQYKIDNYACEAICVLTNKTPNGPTRGAGRVTATFVIERVLERVARQLQLDPADVRMTNLIPTQLMPYDMGIPYRDGHPVTYDSGDYPGQMQRALDELDYRAFRERQQELAEQGRHIGVGIATYVEGTGYGPHEGAIVRVDEAGRVTILSGSNNHGQSHETTLAQVCADALGVDIADVSIRDGDTALIQHGGGTFASRTAVTGGMAVHNAARRVREKVISIVAHRIGVEPEALTIERGIISDASGEGRMTLGEVAAATRPGAEVPLPPGVSPGLEALEYYVPPTVTWSAGTHIATVEVDSATGRVTLDRYLVVHDAGKLINPAVVTGQVVGGVVHGIGNAIYEDAVYSESGELRTTNFIDYQIPRSIDVPSIEVYHQEFPSSLNELGVKGCGEGGTVAAPPAIVNAVEDALRPLDLRITDMPLMPEDLVDYIEQAEARAGG